MKSIYKTWGLVFIGILIGAFVIYKWIQKSRDFTPIAPTNVFKSIEYVEELRLTTYFFEELLILGTPENVKQLRDDLQDEVTDIKNEVRKAQFVVEQAHNNLLGIEDEIKGSNEPLLKAQKELILAKSLWDQINKGKVGLLKMLTSKDDILGDSIQKYYLAYAPVANRWENRRNKVFGSPLNKRMKDTMDTQFALLESAIDAQKKLRENTYLTKKDAVARLEKLAKGDDQRLIDKQKAATKTWKDAVKDVNNIKDDLAKKEAELERADAELESVIESQGDTIKPKLMIIAQAEVSGYVNLKDLKINQRQFDDTLEVYLPAPQLDSVIIKIDDDSTHLYPLSKAELEKTSSDGAYYDIFQQLKNAIIQAEGRVKKRAHDVGIMEETRRLAKVYVQQFASNLDLPIIFTDTLPKLSLLAPPPPPPLPGEVEDTMPKAILNTLKTLDSTKLQKLKETLPDSVKLQLQIR